MMMIDLNLRARKGGGEEEGRGEGGTWGISREQESNADYGEMV